MTKHTELRLGMSRWVGDRVPASFQVNLPLSRQLMNAIAETLGLEWWDHRMACTELSPDGAQLMAPPGEIYVVLGLVEVEDRP